MNLDSDKVSAFFQLALHGSFLKASKSLGISQPALSQKIARLEDELEQTLVVRRPKKLVLTNAGRELVRYFKTKMDLDASYIQSISGKNNIKELRIGSYSSITNSVLIPLLGGLKEEVVLNVVTRELSELENALVNGEADFIFTTKLVNRQNVICEVIAQEKQVHVTPVKGLKELPFLDHDEEDETTFKFLKNQCLPLDITRSFFDEINTIIKAVECGLGQAIVSEHLVLKNKKLRINKASGSSRDSVYLCYYDKAYFSEIQKAFIHIVRDGIHSFL